MAVDIREKFRGINRAESEDLVQMNLQIVSPFPRGDLRGVRRPESRAIS